MSSRRFLQRGVERFPRRLRACVALVSVCVAGCSSLILFVPVPQVAVPRTAGPRVGPEG
jgi:hypothetical protein